MTDFIELSKEISYAIRHARWKYGLKLDENGWVNIKDLLESLHESDMWKDVVEKDINQMIELSSDGWGKILGPNTVESRMQIHKGFAPHEMPPFQLFTK